MWGLEPLHPGPQQHLSVSPADIGTLLKELRNWCGGVFSPGSPVGREEAEQRNPGSHLTSMAWARKSEQGVARGQPWWYTPTIPAAQKAEAGRSQVWCQPGRLRETSSQKVAQCSLASISITCVCWGESRGRGGLGRKREEGQVLLCS